MKTASIRELRHDFGQILEWVANGEEVSITKRRQLVARLVPVLPKKKARAKMPDITARLQKVFGRKAISAREMKRIMAKNRGNW
jgi:prevent-host-death family protein